MHGISVTLLLTILLSACGSATAPIPEAPESPGPSPARSAPARAPDARVVGVNDGDTITVRMNASGREERVRLATVDAPELGQPFGQASRKNLSELVFGKEVILDEVERDQYGRMVAEVRMNGVNVNLEQIRMGYAWHYKRFQQQQTPEQRKAYSLAEESAREGRFGLWRLPDAVPPWDWRKEKAR